MKRTTGGILAVILAAVAVLTGVAAAPARAGGCPSVAYFAIGGNGDPKSVGVPHVPAGWRMNIEYPADVFQGDRSRQIAGDKLDAEAKKLRLACRDTRIGVYGYSLGASAGSIVVDRWQTDTLMNRDTFAVFYGNPRHPIGDDGWGGIEVAGLPHIPFIYRWHGARLSGPIPVEEHCNWRRDVICSAPLPLHSNLIGAWKALEGYLTGDHLY
ncbi:serine hydrolase [Gordonia phage Schmidt]|uniref:Serine hydrolase n=1 Tax=Gordonia phage Schmidt TaxID=2301697 RepID=A0A385E2L9_9CAUD|nr:lysin B [Gordonia phage Schmidt]AXQ65125.1 serine hydrolase [Gordonia phage Schmidt]